MRAAGSVHMTLPSSISSRVALRTSAERAAVRIRNSSASFDYRLARAFAFTFAMQSQPRSTVALACAASPLRYAAAARR